MGNKVKDVKKVAIVGFAPSTKDMAPYNDSDWEIWVLNEYFAMLPKGIDAKNITRWFELHQRDTVLNSSRSKEYIEKLIESNIPIMMCEKHEDIPMSKAYPLDDIIKALGTDYFTNSISYMIAQAIYEGYDEIALYGVDMAQSEEYAKERPSVEYFVGFARAKGIPVYIPKESDICKCPYYYGFQEQTASKILKTLDPKLGDLKVRINNDDMTVDEMLEHIDFYLKKYLFEHRPLVAQMKELSQKSTELNEKLKTASLEESKKIVDEIRAIPNVNIPIFEIDNILELVWQSNQRLKGCKKERLFLAGAEESVSHLRTIMCPFD